MTLLLDTCRRVEKQILISGDCRRASKFVALRRRNAQEDFQARPDVSLPIRNRNKTAFQPHLDVSLPIRNAKQTFPNTLFAQAKRKF